MRPVPFALALLLLGCGRADPSTVLFASGRPDNARNAPSASSFVPGSRLRPRFWKGDDGSEQLVGWYDQHRAENCEPAPGPDGAHRCMPTAMDGNYFEDAACKDPVAVWAPASCASYPKYIRIGASVCGPYELREVDLHAPRRAEVYVRHPQGGCMARILARGEEVFTPGPPVAAAAFVGLVEGVK